MHVSAVASDDGHKHEAHWALRALLCAYSATLLRPVSVSMDWHYHWVAVPDPHQCAFEPLPGCLGLWSSAETRELATAISAYHTPRDTHTLALTGEDWGLSEGTGHEPECQSDEQIRGCDKFSCKQCSFYRVLRCINNTNQHKNCTSPRAGPLLDIWRDKSKAFAQFASDRHFSISDSNLDSLVLAAILVNFNINL